MQIYHPLLAALVAYLIGSLSFAVIVSRVLGLGDPRSYGSGNPGATKVLRAGNEAAGLATLLLVALKGYLPVLLVARFGATWGLGEGTAALVGVAAFVGHLWPVFFGFRGGKVFATVAGVLVGINPWLGLATLLTWLVVAAVSRYVSLASVVAAAFALFYQLAIWGGGPNAAAVGVMSLLLVWRHRANIQRLLKGRENRLGRRAAVNASLHSPHPPHPPHAPHAPHPHGGKASHKHARRKGAG